MALPDPSQPSGATQSSGGAAAAANAPRPVPVKAPLPASPASFEDESHQFDPYYRWLGIPRAEQPPTLYRLLGLSPLEPDLDVIEAAADRQMAHVRAYQTGPRAVESQRLLNELSAAKLTLLHVAKKLAYDRTLRPPAPPPPPGASASRGNAPQPLRPIPVPMAASAPMPVAAPQAAPAPPTAPAKRERWSTDAPAPPASTAPMPASASPAPTALGQPQRAVARPIPAPAVPAPSPVAPRPVPVPVAVKADPDKLVLRDAPTDADDELKQFALKKAPPWAISCVLHMLLLIILGMWYIAADPVNRGIFLDVSSPELGQQLLDDSLAILSEEVTVDAAMVPPSELEKVEDPFADANIQPEVFALHGVKPIPNLETPTIELLLDGRQRGMKELLLGKYGGNGDSENAVELGLAWLARYQRKDGSWSLKGPYKSGSLDRRDLPESATAMALLAFQGAGHTHKEGKYKEQVEKGIKALLSMQAGNGDFFQLGGANNHWFYSHAQCTMAVCELYAMTRDQQLRRPAELAVKFLIDSQDPELGGWRYLPRTDSDTSVTGWVVMAFQSARMAGIEVPSPVLTKIGEYLDQATPDGSQYGYQVGTEPTRAMTAEGLLCRQYLGWRRDDPRLVAGADLLLKYLPTYNDRDVYYWYYGTQTMHHMDGKYWPAWNGALRDMLVKQQEKTGPEKGSWDPLGEHPDRWSNLGMGMRLYTTCLSLYMLEVYYRHLPIYGVRN